ANVDVTIATCTSQENSISSQVEGDYSLVLEPERRDTAPAIMLACAHLAMEQGAREEDTVIVMPIDTYADQEYYDRVTLLDRAVQSGAADLVLLGVEPTYPTGKYGYIVPTSREGSLWPVERFTEKPSVEVARALVENGALWNCGVFAFKLGYMASITRKHVKAESFDELRGCYSSLPKISFDYEIVEKANSIAVVPYAGTWKDLGTWNTLTDEMAEAYSGRVVVDEPTCENVHVVNETGFPLVVAGLSDSVIVATPDGILVSGKEASANIKVQVAKAAETRPMYEKRRWGEYRVIDSSVFPDGRKALTKELVVRQGRQLSYQRHMRRSEVWTIVSGEGEAVLDGEVRKLLPGSVVNVEKKTMHAMRAFGCDLHAIEVQLGDILVEEDIERFGNYWN
ncbi:MAG: sugar phosphate nucleotidyltransferase, partial [Gordonibacter sp.]|uniref:sugar phosphate nucleotidyltransferase n=1 Tax=Gordonibacter sp. TaxID=1968902 RepID=UPI002FCA556C